MTATPTDRDRSVAENAQLALLLEVSGTPKPGNVDRRRDHDGLTYDAFLAGAVGARAGLADAAAGAPVGPAFERAVAGMARQDDGNTQFGALLLLVPLVRAAATGALAPAGLDRLTRGTTVDDAAAFFRAFEHADVTVGDPPEGAAALDVRRGADAVPAVRERGLTLRDVLALNDADDDAREWTDGFPRTFRIADEIAAIAAANDAPPSDCGATAYLRALAHRPDSLVAVEHGGGTAAEVHDRAADLVDLDAAPGTGTPDREAVRSFAADLVDAGINPGTTADCVAAGLFVALERGALVV